MKTTIVLPTYNEAENIPRIVPQILEQDVSDLTLLIVDDNSPDHTGQIAEDLAPKYPGKISVVHRQGKGGLGSAYRHGFRIALDAGADVVGQMDSDFSHPPEKIPELVKAVKDFGLVIGSRYVAGGSVDEKWPLWRKGLSAWGNFYARTILGLPMRDVTGGFRLWRKETLEGMPMERIKSNGYVFQVEMVYVAHRLGYTCGEVPIYFADRKWGQSKMNFRIQLEAAMRVWQVLITYRDLRSSKKNPV